MDTTEERHIAPISDEDLASARKHLRREPPEGSVPVTRYTYSALVARLDRAEAVVEAAEKVGDANFRKLEELLRKGSWGVAANQVQEFRRLLEDWIQATRLDAWHTGGGE